jgi:CRISPR/Cas system CSM-associated protein Csm4 (group 5 of RAMP superfamily)
MVQILFKMIVNNLLRLDDVIKADIVAIIEQQNNRVSGGFFFGKTIERYTKSRRIAADTLEKDCIASIVKLYPRTHPGFFNRIWRDVIFTKRLKFEP